MDKRILMAYEAFNARDVAAALALMHPDVVWPNGMEGGYIHGRDAVRDYWLRQWQTIDPHVAPLHMTTEADGRIVVDVHQVVRDLAGTILINQRIQHVYQLENDLIRNMQIREL